MKALLGIPLLASMAWAKCLFGLMALVLGGCATHPDLAQNRWTKFIEVKGQPDRVPQEWLSTPEGRFAHSLAIPDPVPVDSGYRAGMTSDQYFDWLCKTQAGEYIYKRVEGVKSVFQLRGLSRATESDLGSRFGIEHPELAVAEYLGSPATLFVRSTRYEYFETPPTNWSRKYQIDGGLLRFSGYDEVKDTGMTVESVANAVSRYGFTWRGIKRQHDRENGIAGGEVIVLDLKTKEVLAVRRAFLRSDGIRRTPEGVWWLQGQMCPKFRQAQYLDPRQQHYAFVSSVLKPANSK